MSNNCTTPIIQQDAVSDSVEARADRLNEPLFLSGDIITQTSGFGRCGFNDLVEAAQNPTVGAKNKAAWFAPYMATGKTKEDAVASTFNALILDHDNDNLSRDSLAELYRPFNTEFLAFTTSNHQQTDNRHPEPLNR